MQSVEGCFDQRLRKTVSGTSTYFAPSEAGALLAENPGAWTDYVWLNGRLIGRITGGQFQSIHDDQVGRPEAITDGGGMLVWRAKNFAFDRTVTVTNTVPFNLGFPGQYYDAESGLWNNGFRDYSPALGRYVESDPLGQAAGVNTYAYVGSNPQSYVDPLGLQEEPAEEIEAEMEAFNPKIGPNQVTPPNLVEEQLRDGMCRAPSAQRPSKTPNTGEPGTTYTNPGSGQQRTYGPDGKPLFDVDFDHDHGQGVPHQHNWLDGVRGPGVPLNPTGGK